MQMFSNLFQADYCFVWNLEFLPKIQYTPHRSGEVNSFSAFIAVATRHISWIFTS